jgi:hypothetical protein
MACWNIDSVVHLQYFERSFVLLSQHKGRQIIGLQVSFKNVVVVVFTKTKDWKCQKIINNNKKKLENYGEKTDFAEIR